MSYFGYFSSSTRQQQYPCAALTEPAHWTSLIALSWKLFKTSTPVLFFSQNKYFLISEQSNNTGQPHSFPRISLKISRFRVESVNNIADFPHPHPLIGAEMLLQTSSRALNAQFLLGFIRALKSFCHLARMHCTKNASHSQIFFSKQFFSLFLLTKLFFYPINFMSLHAFLLYLQEAQLIRKVEFPIEHGEPNRVRLCFGCYVEPSLWIWIS